MSEIRPVDVAVSTNKQFAFKRWIDQQLESKAAAPDWLFPNTLGQLTTDDLLCLPIVESDKFLPFIGAVRYSDGREISFRWGQRA